jgi:hypothetical protein
VDLRGGLHLRPGVAEPRTVVVREYGRDSLLVWANLLLAPLFAALGLRVGLQSEAQLEARIEADTAAMRKRGYLVASVETFSLPVLWGAAKTASWYRVTFERTAPASKAN